MREKRTEAAILGLQWSLGLIVLAEALFLALGAAQIKAFSKTGMPEIVRLGLAWGEIAGAVLFLIPATVIVGGRCLVAILLLAAVVHILHGWFDVGALIVYAAASLTVVAFKTEKPR